MTQDQVTLLLLMLFTALVAGINTKSSGDHWSSRFLMVVSFVLVLAGLGATAAQTWVVLRG